MNRSFIDIDLDSWLPKPFIEEIPILNPEKDEIKNFSRFMQKSLKDINTSCGMIKIIPPKTWSYRTNQMSDFEIRPFRQKKIGKAGIYKLEDKEDRVYRFEEFKDYAIKFDSIYAKTNSVYLFERKFWRNIDSTTPSHAVDVQRSFFDPNLKYLNLNNLKTILDIITEKLEGIHKPYLYIGTGHSCFGFQTEDMNLYSINYLHSGKSKIWYSIPLSAVNLFENLAKNFFPKSYQQCSAFLRHKDILIAPFILDYFKIPYARTVQNQGEFIVTLPSSYHQAYNIGFNICESVNFALPNWIPHGLKAPRCLCQKGTFNFDMRVFKYCAMKLHMTLDWNSYKPFDYSPSDDICIKNKAVFYFNDNVHFNFVDILVVWLPFGKDSIQEQQYYAISRANDYLANIPPFCSYCLLFSYKIYKETAVYHEGIYVDQTTYDVPNSCSVHSKMPLFALKNYGQTILPEESELIKCCVCNVRVHKVCMGIYSKTEIDQRWTCDFCSDHLNDIMKITNHITQKCEFCPVKIGIMRRLEGGKYAHVACMLLGKFVFRKKCTFCKEYTANRRKMASCFKCKKNFHVYCGHFNGVFYIQENWPKVVKVLCRKCRIKLDKKFLIPTGSKVSVNISENETANGTVLAYRQPHVASYANYDLGYDVDQDDIMDDENLRNGNPAINVKFQSNLCIAKYIGKMAYVCYRVLLDSGQKYLFSPEEIVWHKAPVNGLLPCISSPE